MKRELIQYQAQGKSLQGYLVYEEKSKESRPAILVAHAWRGQDDFARKKAEFLAELGYVGFALDLYGEGKTAETDEDAAQLMMPLFIDRKTLRERIVAAYHTVVKQPCVNNLMIGAIGFCFGGLSVIELIRSGVPLKGSVSFHGLLGDSLGAVKADTLPSEKTLQGSLLVLHGNKDPLVSNEDIMNFKKEFTEAGVDWQIHIYGNAYHAFTNPAAHDHKAGLIYDPKIEQRALQTMKNFFSEVFE